ncbi:phospholipid carrier-dependent glycosyltransferase [Candidatus Parcubacteria bacterium]|nr:MAG: phospholipid carrier-dependent glycosyltransferase [Candidatus Parcubacteria bacterium]
MSRKYILILIILLAFILRFYQISNIPPSLTWDEAAWGYNAYSLGINGRDEFGKFLPITYIESFGDFKPPLYAYLSILPIKLFGLNEFSVRFASAFLGTLTVLLTYFLTKQIFSQKSQLLDIWHLKFGIPEVASLLLAISPWHILLSRAAFEANVATFFIVLGVLLFFISTQNTKGASSISLIPLWIWRRINTSGGLFLLSVLSFTASMYTFNTARVVVPLLVFGLITGKRKALLNIKKQVFIAAVIGFIIFLPLGLFLKTPQAQLRFQEVNIFSDPSVIERSNQQIKNDNNAFWSKIIHNRRLAYSVEFLRHYFDNLNPSFLFFKGDGNPKFSTQDIGQMYVWELPFFIFGFLYLFRNRQGNWWIVPYWLLIAILPAATARETPHALRIEAALPTFQIITAYGLFQIISNFKFQISNFKLNYLLPSIVFVLALFNLAYFMHNYFVHYPREFSGEWQYGYREAINYAKSVEDQYSNIYLTDSLGRPYIYTLFYTQYDPNKFLQEAKIEREVFGFVKVKNFGKYTFEKTQEPSVNTLFIDRPGNVPGGANILKEFYLLNGEKILTAYTI